MIRNILLDLDETILDFHKAEHIALSKTLEHMGIVPTQSILDRYSQINQAQWKLLELGEYTMAQIKERRYRLLFEELGEDCSPAEATAYYEKMLGVGHYFIEGAEEMVRALSENYRLYIASNGTASVQHSRLNSAGLKPYLSGIFLSQEIGYHKPQTEFFQKCFSQISDFRREETVMVGDSLTSDIKGGDAAGLVTIWFNPKKEENKTEVHPTYEICRLSELEPLLKRISP